MNYGDCPVRDRLGKEGRAVSPLLTPILDDGRSMMDVTHLAPKMLGSGLPGKPGLKYRSVRYL